MTNTVSLRRYAPSENIWGNPNVIDAVKNVDTTLPIQTPTCIYRALNNLVQTRPNWRFIIASTDFYSISQTVTYRMIKTVNITEDGEDLGFLDVRWKGSNMKLYVQNDRLSAKRERQHGYFTEDPAKAELAIRKHFYRLAKPERIKKAMEVANTVISHTAHSKEWDTNRAANSFMGYSEQFVEKHMDMYVAEFPQQVQAHEKFVAAKAESELAKRVKDLFDKQETLTVVLDGEHYVVAKSAEPVATQTFTDSTLTYDMRKKIGMLKLVQDGQMISDIGCRVDESIFVLLPEDQTKEQE